MRSEYPLPKGNLGAFIDGADSNGELLSAFTTVIPARPHRLAAKGLDLGLGVAIRAISTIGPVDRHKVFAGF